MCFTPMQRSWMLSVRAFACFRLLPISCAVDFLPAEHQGGTFKQEFVSADSTCIYEEEGWPGGLLPKPQDVARSAEKNTYEDLSS